MYFHRDILSLRVGFQIHNFIWDYIDDLLVSLADKNLTLVIWKMTKGNTIQSYIGFVAAINEIFTQVLACALKWAYLDASCRCLLSCDY